MVKLRNRVVAGALSMVFVGQVMLFGDGTANGILHPDTIAHAAEVASNERYLRKLIE